MSERVKEMVESMERQNSQEIKKKKREKHVGKKRRGRSSDNFSEKPKRTRLRPITSVNTACLSSDVSSSNGFSNMDHHVHHISTQTQSASYAGIVTANIEGILL